MVVSGNQGTAADSSCPFKLADLALNETDVNILPAS